jgi:hypothetical protein
MNPFFPPFPDSLVRRVNTRSEAIEYLAWLAEYGTRAKAQIEVALRYPSDDGLPHTLAREHNERIEQLHQAFVTLEREHSASDIERRWLIGTRVISKAYMRGTFDLRQNVSRRYADVFSQFDDEIRDTMSRLATPADV